MSWRIGQLRWQGVIGTLNPRSRCPLMIFIGALSMTFFAIAPRTCAALTIPTGALLREKIPPSDAVTIAASAGDWRMTSAPRSTRSPRSLSAPSGEAMLSSSGMDGPAPREREIGELARGDHSHHRLVLVGDDGEATFVLGHQRDDLTQPLMLVDEQR